MKESNGSIKFIFPMLVGWFMYFPPFLLPLVLMAGEGKQRPPNDRIFPRSNNKKLIIH